MLVVANELIETIEDPQTRDMMANRYLRGQQETPGGLDALPADAQTVRRILDGAESRRSDDPLWRLCLRVSGATWRRSLPAPTWEIWRPA